jgi:hypothetical protein
MDDDELREQVRNARLAVQQARKQVENAWSAYRSLVRMRIDVGVRVQQALAKGEKDIGAHQEYAALRPQLEAQRQVLREAMVDLAKSETELRVAYEAAFGSQGEE